MTSSMDLKYFFMKSMESRDIRDPWRSSGDRDLRSIEWVGGGLLGAGFLLSLTKSAYGFSSSTIPFNGIPSVLENTCTSRFFITLFIYIKFLL